MVEGAMSSSSSPLVKPAELLSSLYRSVQVTVGLLLIFEPLTLDL